MVAHTVNKIEGYTIVECHYGLNSPVRGAFLRLASGCLTLKVRYGLDYVLVPDTMVQSIYDLAIGKPGGRAAYFSTVPGGLMIY